MVPIEDQYSFREATREQVQYCLVPKLKKYMSLIRLKPMFYTYTLYNLYKEIYTNILSELKPIFKSKHLNFKQNPLQSASSAPQGKRCFDFSPTQFCSIDLLSCAGEILELRNLLDVNEVCCKYVKK